MSFQVAPLWTRACRMVEKQGFPLEPLEKAGLVRTRRVTIEGVEFWLRVGPLSATATRCTHPRDIFVDEVQKALVTIMAKLPGTWRIAMFDNTLGGPDYYLERVLMEHDGEMAVLAVHLKPEHFKLDELRKYLEAEKRFIGSFLNV